MGLFSCLQNLPVWIYPVVLLGLAAPTYIAYTRGVRRLLSVRYLIAWLRAVAGWIVYLFKKKLFLALSILTTYGATIHTLYLALQGGKPFGRVGGVFLAESGAKYLGSVRNIGQGLAELYEFLVDPGVCGAFGHLGLLRDSFIHVWQGAAAIYMLLFLYELYRGRWQKADVDKWEQALVVTILVLVIAVVQGTGVVEAVLSDAVSVADILAQGGNGSVANVTANATSLGLDS